MNYLKTVSRCICMLSVVLMGWGAAAFGYDRPGGLGLGVVLGDPTGLTMKYFMTRTDAFDLGVATDGDYNLYGDYLWHGWRAFPQPAEGRLAGYLGLGMGIKTREEAEFGLRTVGGVSYWFERCPVELFAELVPVFRLTHRGGVDLDGGIGVRYYFQTFN